ncbi:hypothetical protein SDJN03_27399, partial [Cucurbita argyrosperma subsp. sororia]
MLVQKRASTCKHPELQEKGMIFLLPSNLRKYKNEESLIHLYFDNDRAEKEKPIYPASMDLVVGKEGSFQARNTTIMQSERRKSHISPPPSDLAASMKATNKAYAKARPELVPELIQVFLNFLIS